MENLAQQRCYNHGHREAAACCLECGRFFCRECVTEHEGRVVCSRCLERLSGRVGTPRFALSVLFKILQVGLSFSLLWLFFYLMGQGLLALPSSFHEGTFWKAPLGWQQTGADAPTEEQRP